MTRPGFAGFQITIELAPLEQIAREIVQQPDPEVLREGMKNACDRLRQIWVGAVQGNLLEGMTRPVMNDDYAEALNTGAAIRLPAPWWGMVVSTYPGTMRIERGTPPFDIKPGLLNSPNAKLTEEGHPYQDVPFRHYTPGGTRKPHEAHFGERVHGQTMPPHVYKEAKRIEPGGRVQTGTDLEWIGMRSKLLETYLTSDQQQRLRKQMGLSEDDPLTYRWKAGLYAGMVRGGRARHGQYWTFRRVSRQSSPASWWHPGIPPNPVMESVAREAKPEIARMLAESYCQAIGRPDLVDRIEII